jgi:hypothetical protein
MAVTVCFKNGTHATSGSATKVDHEAVPYGSEIPDTNIGPGIALKDDADKVVGRFLMNEIVGYFTHDSTAAPTFH